MVAKKPRVSAPPRKKNPQVRVNPSLLKRAEVLIAAQFDGITSHSKLADAAIAYFLSVKEQQYQRLVAFQAWEAGGRKGPPPGLTTQDGPR